MIYEKFETELKLSYETTKEVLQEHLDNINGYIDARQQAKELQEVSEEELQEFYPDVKEEKERLEAAMAKLEDEATSSWWVELTLERLKEAVSEEEGKILEKALEIQDRIENIMDDSSADLVGYLSKGLSNGVVVQ